MKRRLRELNIEIVRLEEESTPHHKRQLTATLDAKKGEIAALDSARPQDIPKPDTQTAEQKALAAEVEKLTGLLAILGEEYESITSMVTASMTRLQDATSLKGRLTAFETNTTDTIDELKDQLSAFGLKSADLIEFSVDPKPLDEQIAGIKKRVANLKRDNKHEFSADTNFLELSTLPDLLSATTYIETAIETLKEQLTGPQRHYQRYLNRLQDWKVKRQVLVGSPDDPKPGTLNRLEQELRYVDEKLASELEERRVSRHQLGAEIFESKTAILDFYGDVKQSVKERLQAVRTDGFDIEIDASFVMEHNFRRQFLNHIDQRKRGPNRNNQDAQKEIAALVGDTNWNELDAVVAFCDNLIDRMRSDTSGQLLVSEQCHDLKQLYDFAYSLDYLSSKYELRLGGKNLNELSPGEKGLLLLIFYLQLDKKNRPLIIDQPEDNLDNESIFKVLAKCIRHAKKHRQVILVTHNPNLAVGADAEQIVFVQLEKSANYKFSYESGAIENPILNGRIVNVLEGSQPAFVKRRLKYGIR